MSTRSSLEAVFDLGNLKRAWRWIAENPDRLDRQICQSAYADSSAYIDEILTNIADVGRRSFYEASSVRRIELPKTPALSRPYSVLSIRDQIVYQAMVNLVAERLHSRVKHWHFDSSFSHIYAGRTSKTFYRRWQTCRREYNRKARRAFSWGLTTTATFDVAACYDTISHAVVDRGLTALGFDHTFRDSFRRLIGIWTMSEASACSLDSGIPQGPAASGTVSELVLEAFDIEFEKGVEPIEYMRYVDDLRLFGRDEGLLRRVIWRFERVGRELGMHPQPSKVDIRAVTDINAELKSVSVPPEEWKTASGVDQVGLRRRLFQLTRGAKVENETRFKYCLPAAAPNARLTAHALKVLECRPDLFLPITMYLRKHRCLSSKCGDALVRVIKTDQIRPYVRGVLLDVSFGRLGAEQDAALTRSVKSLSMGSADADLELTCRKRLVRLGLAGQTASRKFVCKGDWWNRAEVVRCLSNETISLRGLLQILEPRLGDESAEVAMAAAVRLAKLKLVPRIDHASVNPAALPILQKAFGRREGNFAPCGIDYAFSKLLAEKVPKPRWRQFLRSDYKWMEQQAIHCERLASSDPTAFVNALDAFLDGLVSSLYRVDRSLGTYQSGNLGGILGSSRLCGSYPGVFALLTLVHAHRSRSRYSHMVDRRTGRKTGALRWRLVEKVKSELRRALCELSKIL
jgi:hypothetical protein